MHQRIPVITAEAPFRRYAPHPDPLLLEDGAFADVQNVVIDQGLPRVRDGVGAFSLNSATAISGGVFYGGGIFEFGSGRIAVRAILVGTVIRIEYSISSNGTTWSGWAEATHTSGPGGNTRMTKPDLGLVQFQMVPASNQGSARIIIQTGKEEPRLMAIGDPEHLRIVRPVAPPSGIESHPAIASVSGYVNYAAGTPTASHSGIADYFAVGSINPGPNRIYEFGPSGSGAIDAGMWAQVVYSSGDKGDFTGAKQAFLLLSSSEENDPYSWLKHKIYLLTGATPDLKLIYDPNDAAFSAVQAPTGCFVLGEVIVSAFNLEGLGDGGLNDVRGVRFEAVDDLTDPANFCLYGILAGGRVNGAASYKISHHSKWMHSESPGVTLRYGAAARVGDFDAIDRLELALGESSAAAAGDIALPGVPRAYVNVPVSITLPVEPSLYYKFLVPILSPTEDEGGHGVDEARVYRRDPGEGQYSLVSTVQTAEYDSGWTYSDAEHDDIDAWNKRVYVEDNAARESKLFELPAPSAQNTSVPQGYAMTMGSSRLYVGASRTEDSFGGQSVVYASDLDLAMRFRNVNASGTQTIADREAFVIGLAREDALALRATATSAIGIEGVYCWTSKSLYRLSDLRAERIGGEGIGAPNSAAEKSGLVFWLDNQNEIEGFAGQATNLSRSRVESVLNQIPAARRKFAVGAVWKDTYYLAHSGAESSENRYAFVYSLVRGQFEGRFLLPAGMGPVQFQMWDYEGDTRMLYWDATGRLWEWLKPGQIGDDGDSANIVLSLTTKRYRPSPAGRLAFRRTQIVADDGEATWTVSHDVEGQDSPVVGTIVMPDSGSHLMQVYDSASGSSTSPIGGAGYSVQTTLSAALPAGTRLCEWVFEGREVHVAAGTAG